MKCRLKKKAEHVILKQQVEQLKAENKALQSKVSDDVNEFQSPTALRFVRSYSILHAHNEIRLSLNRFKRTRSAM